MALPASGQISLSQVSVELGRAATATTSLGESAVRSLAGVPSGAISLSNLWGKSSAPNIALVLGGAAASNPVAISKFDYATEAISATGTNLVKNRNQATAQGSNSHLYSSGGVSSGTSVSDVEYTSFSTFTSAATGSSLSAAISRAFRPNSGTKGYSAGGIVSPTYLTSIQAITYSTNGVAGISATLPTPQEGGATASSSSRGYTLSGYTGPNTYTSEIAGIQFSTEAAINPSAATSYSAYGPTTGTNSTTKGYMMGGGQGYAAGTMITTMAAFTFSTETAANISATLPIVTKLAGGCSSATRGYSMGGYTTSNAVTAEIAGVIFSTEAANNPSAVLSTAAGIPQTGQPYAIAP